MCKDDEVCNGTVRIAKALYMRWNVADNWQWMNDVWRDYSEEERRDDGEATGNKLFLFVCASVMLVSCDFLDLCAFSDKCLFSVFCVFSDIPVEILHVLLPACWDSNKCLFSVFCDVSDYCNSYHIQAVLARAQNSRNKIFPQLQSTVDLLPQKHANMSSPPIYRPVFSTMKAPLSL